MRYLVLRPFWLGGTAVQIGSVIELTSADVAMLLAAGKVQRAPAEPTASTTETPADSATVAEPRQVTPPRPRRGTAA